MIPKKIKTIMEKLETAGFEAYIVGGAVRDIILKVEPQDYDIFTNATGKDILKVFPGGKVLGGAERQEKILTVIVDDVEISQYRSNGERTETGTTLTAHQATCDFTMNAIAMDKNRTIIDNHNGIRDINDEVIRFVGKPQDRINEDYLRLLRGIKFVCKYGFRLIDAPLFKSNAKRIKDLPQERVREELMKILSYEEGMSNIIFYGFIKYIFPEYRTVIGMKGGDHHDEIVDEHMLNAFDVACTVTNNVNLRLACFLHDIGKGVTYTEEDGDQTHFYEHENRGQEMVEERLLRLKFSNEDIKYITTLIRLHMYSYKVKPSKKSYIRFFNKLEEAKIPIEDYVMLIYADHQGNLAKPRFKFGDFIKGNWLHKKYYEIKYSEEPMKVKDLKISGKDVMEILKIKPGPEIGEVLSGVFELVMDGEAKNERAELMHRLKKWNQ